jgi:mRNA-degrading endonuclease RelE of RelBE toxin-antitoxin system
VFDILFEVEALAELDTLRAFDRTRIIDEVEKNLRKEPLVESRRKKILHGLTPPWHQVRPVWQLRVGDFRVFYDVDEANGTVIVRSVRRKGPHRTTEEIL